MQAPGDDRRRREDLLRFAQRHPVELEHLASQRSVLGRLGELPELGAIEVPGLAELMEQPHHLVRMLDHVRRKLRRDHGVDRPAVRLLEVEKPPEERLGQHALARIPLERNGDELRLVPVLAQLVDDVGADEACTAGHDRPHPLVS